MHETTVPSGPPTIDPQHLGEWKRLLIDLLVRRHDIAALRSAASCEQDIDRLRCVIVGRDLDQTRLIEVGKVMESARELGPSPRASDESEIPFLLRGSDE